MFMDPMLFVLIVLPLMVVAFFTRRNGSMIYVPIISIVIFLSMILSVQYINESILTSLNEQLLEPSVGINATAENQTAIANETAAVNGTAPVNETIPKNETQKLIAESLLKTADSFNIFFSLFPIIIAFVGGGIVIAVLPRFMRNDYGSFEPSPGYSFSSSSIDDDDTTDDASGEPINVEVSKPIVQQAPEIKKDKHELHIDELMAAWTALHPTTSARIHRAQRMLFENDEYKTKKRGRSTKPAKTKISPVESNTPYGK